MAAGAAALAADKANKLAAETALAAATDKANKLAVETALAVADKANKLAAEAATTTAAAPIAEEQLQSRQVDDRVGFFSSRRWLCCCQ